MKFRWLPTPREVAKTVAARWRNQYGPSRSNRSDGWGRLIRGDSEDIYNRLVALGPDPDPKEVDEIIGTTGWTSGGGMCTGCGTYATTIQIGDEPDYESSTVVFCDSCMRSLIAFFNAGRPVE